MRVTDFERIKADLEHLRTSQPYAFGAEAHDCLVNPPLTESEVQAFEKKHNVTLPKDYRQFLLVVGNGGVGPEYGLFKLGEMDDGFTHSQWHENNGFIGTLAQPFPHITAWNDLTGELEESDFEDEADEAQHEAFEERYWNPVNVNGAVPICHLGCALRLWLIITGPEAGNVWYDGRVDREGLRPLVDARSNRVSFYRWYRNWLDNLLP